MGLNVITLLMVVVTGRITPVFSANWLRANGGNPDWVTRSVQTDRLAIANVVLLIALELFGVPAAVIGDAALVVGFINDIRLIQWAGWRVIKEPLLWILHVAYLWIVAALLLRGLSSFTSIGDSLWQHALRLGGIGIWMITLWLIFYQQAKLSA